MSPDEWQAHVTTEAALAMGAWLEARGRLDRPIASLTRHDLECMATSAISRFIVLASEHRTTAPDPEQRDAMDCLLFGEAPAPSAAAKRAGSHTATASS